MAPHGTASFEQHFQDLQDPRVERTRKHPLINIVFMTVCGVLSGANSIAGIHEFAIDRRGWFARYLDLSNGIPSEDTFGRVLARLDPAAFEKCLLGWIRDVQELTADRVVAIDGKTLRGSADREAGRAAIHMVSAWATENKLSLGQVVVDEKSNEITAIPESAGPAGDRRGPGDDRRDGLPEGDRREDPRSGGRLRPGRQAEPADAVRAGRGGDRRGPGGGRRGARRAQDRREGARPSGDEDVRGRRGAGGGRSGGAVARPECRGDRDLGAGGLPRDGRATRSATTSSAGGSRRRSSPGRFAGIGASRTTCTGSWT